jgi:hypothetical protein
MVCCLSIGLTLLVVYGCLALGSTLRTTLGRRQSFAGVKSLFARSPQEVAAAVCARHYLVVESVHPYLHCMILGTKKAAQNGGYAIAKLLFNSVACCL